MTKTPQIEIPHGGADSTHGSATVTNGATGACSGSHNIRSSPALIF